MARDVLLVNRERWPAKVHGYDESESPEPWEGLRAYDVAEPLAPRPLGALSFESGRGDGVHRTVWTGGRYGHASLYWRGELSWIVLDLADPAHPVEAARWRLDEEAPQGERWYAHHALVAGDLAFLGYGQANLVVLDVSDFRAPKQVGRLRWGPGFTHTCLPLPGRDLLVVTDEAISERCAAGRSFVRVVDIADPAAPRILATCPEPEGDFCERGLRFGPHNLHENRPGSYRSERLVFATYFNAGLRVYDLEDPAHPVEIAHWLPEAAPGQEAPQANDLYVEESGVVWVTDRVGGGVAALQPEPWLASLMADYAAS